MASRRETHTRYATPYRRWPVSLYNALASTGDWRKLFDPERLLRSAQKAAGETELSDAPLMEPLTQLCKSIREEADLNPFGAFMQSTRIKTLITNRLRMDALIRANPEWLEAPDPDIVVIAGLARTGTTLLHRILCSDPDVRAIPSWETINPAPLSGESGGEFSQRLKQAQTASKFMNYVAPDFSAIHEMVPEGPEEDILLLDLTMMSQTAEALMHVPSWSKWLESADHVPAYEYLRKVLKVLIGLNPGERLVLKTPHHSEHLAALMTVFPEALIVRTYRDPAKTMPSCCSMMAHMYGVGSNRVDPHWVGEHWLAKSMLMSANAQAAREAYPDRAFVDLLYADLIADPVAAAEQIYEAWGHTLPDNVRAVAEVSTRRKSTSARMRHVYRLEDFGLTATGVRAAFTDDISRFGIPEEKITT